MQRVLLLILKPSRAGSEGSAPVAAMIPAVMAPAAVEEVVARTAIAAQSVVDAAVAPDAAICCG